MAEVEFSVAKPDLQAIEVLTPSNDDIIQRKGGVWVNRTMAQLLTDLGIGDAMIYKGAIDCSANPNYPAANRGDTYKVSVAGKIGGGSGPNVEIGDTLICSTDSTASGTHAGVGASWGIIQQNVDGAYFGGGTDVPIADGGTGASTAAGARTNLDAAIDTRPVVAKTADYTVLVADHNTIFTNTGAGGVVIFTLPASAGCAAGKTRYTFFATQTDGIQVKPNGSDHLFLTDMNGSALDATNGAPAANPGAVGDYLTIVFIGGAVWACVGNTRGWTV